MSDRRFENIPLKHFTIFKQEAFLFQQINKQSSVCLPGNTDVLM